MQLLIIVPIQCFMHGESVIIFYLMKLTTWRNSQMNGGNDKKKKWNKVVLRKSNQSKANTGGSPNLKKDFTTKLDQMEMEAWVRSLIREKDEFYHIYECYSAGELPIKAMQSAASILNCLDSPKRLPEPAAGIIAETFTNNG